MAGLTESITVDDDTVQRAIAGLLRQSLSLREPFEEIGSMLVASTQQRIQDEEAPDGTPWPELAESTKRARYRGRPRGGDHMLRRSVRLYDSITYEASDTRLAEGTNVLYAALQNFGGEEDMPPGPAAVPARQYLGLSEADEREMGEILLEAVAGSVQ